MHLSPLACYHNLIQFEVILIKFHFQFIDRTYSNQLRFISYIGHFQLTPLGSSYLKHSIYIGNGTYRRIIIQNQCYTCQPFPRLLIKNNSLHPDCRSFLGNFFFEYQD